MKRTKYNKKRSRGTKRKTRGRSSISYKSDSKNKIKIIFLFILMIISLYYIIPDSITLKVGIDEYKKEEIKEIVREVLEENNTSVQQETAQLETDNTVVQTEQPQEQQEQPQQTAQVTSRGSETPRQEETNILTEYQITSYHPGDGCASGTKTGSGLTTNDFSTIKIGNKNVYTYKGQIVVATATEELLKSGYNVKGSGTRQQGKHYFNYFDTFKINIDGNYYNAIVLDSCGAAMWSGEHRIDLYVPTSSDVINKSNVSIKI